MKRILKNKRGMALESAVMFMLLIFTLGMLMTGTSMIMHLRVRLNDKTIQREITIEQIGEKFVNSVIDEGNIIDFKNFVEAKGYYCNISMENEKTILDLTNKVNTVLYIKIEGGKVAKWQYSKPTE